MPKPKARREDDARTSANAQRILRAADRLFATRGYRNVSVRDIAETAGVTHPLIYHYFGSKRDLFAAVLEKNQSRMRAAGDRDVPVREMILALVRANFGESRTYLLSLTRAFADGMRPADWPGGFPGVEAILERLIIDSGGEVARVSDHEVRRLVAVIVAMSVGWTLLEDQILEIVGLSEGDRDHARECLVEAIGRVIGPVLPPDCS
ncbi:MAG TPA: TetR/AcrR family transcriptional regulator [Vicinamibacterales bacterium]|nr:TetR/AcrR family transcriptional regulator [Vicinamibacterales bacterium]